MNLIFTLFLLMVYHPLHVTLTSIDYNSLDEKCEITIKIFSDDFEIALEKYSNQDLNINSVEETKNIEEIITSYIENNFSIIFDDKKHDLMYISKENNHEATWLKFEIGISDFQTINIQNNLLLNVYDDQKNLIIFKNGDFQKGFNLDSNKKDIVISNK
jgi:Domain of unknown function (DUF6702)